jgi:hypothetical protein
MLRDRNRAQGIDRPAASGRSHLVRGCKYNWCAILRHHARLFSASAPAPQASSKIRLSVQL